MCWTGLSRSGALEQLEQLTSFFHWLGKLWQGRTRNVRRVWLRFRDFWSLCLPLISLFSFGNSPGQQTRTCSESSLLRRGYLTFPLYLASSVSANITIDIVKAIPCFDIEVIPRKQWSPAYDTSRVGIRWTIQRTTFVLQHYKPTDHVWKHY